MLVIGISLLGVAVSLIFVPLLSEIIESVQEKEGLGENPLLNDKASAVFNAAYATGCVTGPLIGGALNDAFSVIGPDGTLIKEGFAETCDVMACSGAVFATLYFFVAIVPGFCK
jgi:MFS family permease